MSDLAFLTDGELANLQDAIDGSLISFLKLDPIKIERSAESEIAAMLGTGWTSAVNAALPEVLDKLMSGPLTKERINGFAEALGVKLKKPLTDRQLGIVQDKIKGIYRIAQEATAREVRAQVSFSQRNYAATEFISRSQKMWVGRFYDDQLSDRIKGVSEDVLLNQGLGHREAGKALREAVERELGTRPGGRTDLASAIPARYAGDPDRYFKEVASISSHQARVFAKVDTYDQAGVISYQLVNPMDERTSRICEEMNGQVFSVKTANNQMQAMIGAANPDEVREVQPWLSPGQLSTMLQGTERGSEAASRILAQAGAVLPPFHPLCRTEPVILSYEQPKPMPVPEAITAPVVESPVETEPQPQASSPLDYLLRSGKAIRSTAGEAVPGDGAFVENQDIRYRLEKWDGEDHVVARFKLTPQAGKDVARTLESMGAEETYEIQPFRRAKVDLKSGEIDHDGDKSPLRFSGLRHGKGKPTEMSMITKDGALKNFVEIRVKGSDLKHAHDEVARLMREAGVRVDTLPTAADVRSLQQARIITQWDQTAWSELQALPKITPEAVDEIFARAVERNPKLKKILADMKQTWVGRGHLANYSEAQAKMFQDAGVRFLYHDISNPEAVQWILGDAQGSGLLASTQRYERGLFFNGQSTPRDFETGGADSVFARIQGAGKDFKREPFVRVVIDPKTLGRSDWYFFNSDEYGASGPEMYRHRTLAPDLLKLAKKPGELGGSNEVMFQHSIPVENMKCIVINDRFGARKEVLQALRDRGITEINGKKIEDFILDKMPDNL